MKFHEQPLALSGELEVSLKMATTEMPQQTFWFQPRRLLEDTFINVKVDAVCHSHREN